MAAEFAQPVSAERLFDIYKQGFFSDPEAYRATQMASPIEDMLGSSPILDLVRQRLPQNVGETRLGQWLDKQLPKPKTPDGAVANVRNAVASIPLGGYSREYRDEYATTRASNPQLRRDTVQVGMVPAGNGTEIPTGDSFRSAAAQAAGVATADLMSDGLRNIWWFLNAPQALATLATLQAANQAGRDYVGPYDGDNLLHRGRMRLAAAVPAAIGMSLAVGNFGRQPGYTAAVPSEADPTQTADPVLEAGSRFFLGRTGSLLPYEEFAKERPDVSRGEYEEYKAYLFGNKSPIKATFDGIQGPEVTFMGKSIPILTGVLPAVAAVAGTAYGVRKAGRVLASKGLLAKEEDLLREAATQVLGDERMATIKPERLRYALDREIEDQSRPKLNPETWRMEPGGLAPEAEIAYRAYRDQEEANQGEILKQALLNSSLGLTGAGISGQLLELMRRSLDGEDASTPPPAAPAS